MSYKSNPRQLVMRRDTATGLTLVGWAADLPIGRFEHLKLIGDAVGNALPEPGDEYYETYQSALENARQANTQCLEQQVQLLQSKGWLRVPFELANAKHAVQTDTVGTYTAAALRLHFQLTHNCKQAWAILQEGTVAHVRARHPRYALDELTYQVWYHQQLQQLKQMGGILTEGELKVCESGLWFEPFN